MKKQYGIPDSLKVKRKKFRINSGPPCPKCKCRNSLVSDSRANPEGTRRRRVCMECSRRFTTQELVIEEPAIDYQI